MPSFSQHNLHVVVLGRCLLILVMKFEDKFARLQQLNSPNSQDKFSNIYCIRHVIIIVRFLANFVVFACFCEFCGISQIYLNFVALRLREISEALIYTPGP